ncbi:MAG: glutamate 5-kinase [Micropepsaceae bacterium]
MSARLSDARRIVIKIGSSTLVSPEGEPKRAWLAGLAADIADLKARGAEVIVVSSGAIALGRRRLKLSPGALRLEEAQAAASVGQIALAEAWTEALAAKGLTAAQILLTLDDTEERRRYLNARATIGALLGLSAVPVINENDTVATAEIRFGDNDRLAARVAAMTGADCLVLLSDIDGLYTDNPVKNADATFLPEIAEITPEIEAMAGRPGSDMGSGGMITKLLAAKIATAAGCHMAIALGQIERPLQALANGSRATWVLAKSNPAAARKQWILGALKPAGTLSIDAGAEAALRGGKSLLPIGVTAVTGDFERGDAVIVRNATGAEIARGLVAYEADEARRLIGRRSGEIEAVLGYAGRAAMIHRDDLVVL